MVQNISIGLLKCVHGNGYRNFFKHYMHIFCDEHNGPVYKRSRINMIAGKVFSTEFYSYMCLC